MGVPRVGAPLQEPLFVTRALRNLTLKLSSLLLTDAYLDAVTGPGPASLPALLN